MLTRVIVTILFFAAPLDTLAVERVRTTTPRIAVLIDSRPRSDDEFKNNVLNLSLALAVKNYAHFYFFSTGHEPEAKLLEYTDTFEKHLSRLKMADYDAIIHLRPRGISQTRTIYARGKNRRGRFIKESGFLELVIDYDLLIIKNGHVVNRSGGRVKDRARLRWLSKVGNLFDYTADSLRATIPEPFEYIIKRSLEKILSKIPAKSVPKINSAFSIPMIVQVDSALIDREGVDWQIRISKMTAVASQSFVGTFGRALDIKRIEALPTRTDVNKPLREIQTALKEMTGHTGDTLVVTILDQVPLEDYFLKQSYDEIGLSELGQKFVIVRLIPSISNEYNTWRPYFDGLTLLHEIGHAFGAIHVSDMNSVMSHSTGWLASERFDPFNRTIIEAALSGKLKFNNPATYVSFISKTLRKISYGLADYPAFFDSYLNYGNNRLIEKKLRKAIDYQPQLLATRGHLLLLKGEKEKAAKLFQDALIFDRHQASLYYYLALSEQGSQSLKAMKTAAKLGYLKAITALRR